MKKILVASSIFLTVIMTAACTHKKDSPPRNNTEFSSDKEPDSINNDGIKQAAPRIEEEETINILLRVGSATFTANLYTTDSTDALLQMLPMTLDMNDLNRNEKFFYLPEPLPIDSEIPGTIREGDIMLYGTDCLVLFYETFESSYRYTKLGYIENTSGLAEAAGNGSIQVTLEAAE